MCTAAAVAIQVNKYSLCRCFWPLQPRVMRPADALVQICHHAVAMLLQVFARAAKYSLFDPAKEMVYIEMDADEKKQGKAAVDLVGSQVGVSQSLRALLLLVANG